MVSELVKSGNMVLEIWSRPNSGALLFYPGSMLAPGHYQILVEAFSHAGFTVAGLHLPGHGERRKETDFTFASLLEAGLEAEAVLANLGYKNIALAGHSQGGIVGLAHIAKSSRLTAAFLISAVYPDLPEAIDLTRFAPLAPYRQQLLKFLHLIARLCPRLPVPLPFYLQLSRILAGRKFPLFMGKDKGRIAYPLRFLVSLFEAEIAAQAKCPVVLFNADNDSLFTRKLTEAVFERMQAPDKQLCWLAGGGGHMAPLNPQLADFIARSAAEKCASLNFPLSLGAYNDI